MLQNEPLLEQSNQDTNTQLSQLASFSQEQHNHAVQPSQLLRPQFIQAQFGQLQFDQSQSVQGYLKGTINSENRAQLILQHEELKREARDKMTEAQALAAKIPPQITKSQQSYIERRKQHIKEEQNKLVTQGNLPHLIGPKPQVQSRYMQAAPVSPYPLTQNKTSSKAKNLQVATF